MLTNFDSKGSDSPNFKKSLNIRGKLLLGFFSIAFILLMAVSYTLFIVNSTQQYSQKVLNVDLPIYHDVYDLALQIGAANSSLRGWLIAGDNHFKSDFDQSWNNIARIQVSIDGILNMHPESSFKQNWQQIKSLLARLKNAQISLFSGSYQQSISNPNFKTTIDLENSLLHIIDGEMNAYGERSKGLLDIQYENLSAGANNILADLNLIKLAEIVLILTIVFFSAIIALYTANKITLPLLNAIDIAKKIAEGRRDNQININSSDETGTLLAALAAMQQSILDSEIKLRQTEENTRSMFERILSTAKDFSMHSSKVAAGDLRERLNITDDDALSKLGIDLNLMTESLSMVTGQITQASHNITSTLEEVRQAVSMQTSGASEQAASINQITSSLEEIEKSSAQTLEKANTLGQIAERTREKGIQGLEAVEQSIQGMKSVREKVQVIAQTILDLSNQTQQVGEITSVVNSLAQQSKMLALNASIEAAKAGDAGKGFAVVAAEVKNLAEQSEQSTTQVQKILEDIRHATEKAVMVTEEGTKGVDQGTTLVEQTGEVVRDLSDVINEATVASQQISAAVRQEGVGIEQITVGMNEINQVTSSFVASAQQTLESINHLANITSKLKEKVDTYKI